MVKRKFFSETGNLIETKQYIVMAIIGIGEFTMSTSQ
jgi:hypothetical protein